ncbi:hypothetical protein CFK37_06575 [Virgibacillus phasianinus]|uniref:Uncharacterized protein n=1 Tax=Virgibacillus phasianinus TaxID=2017483 RepID=A0A220U1N8_9BACI|nr:hypothetical protein [Virgibacillus phasianinus]ASK61846.1 hypothetical protein CFK37_06575 [Virgibacillus phasianinus]
MLISSNFNDLQGAKSAIDNLKAKSPTLFQKFRNTILLTRQLQYGYQYMGCLVMDENPTNFSPMSQNDYVLFVYQQEIEKLKTDSKVQELKNLLATYKQVSYANICKLAIGTNPRALVGPAVVR